MIRHLLIAASAIAMAFTTDDKHVIIMFGLLALNSLATAYDFHRHMKALRWFAGHVYTGGPKHGGTAPKDLEDLVK